MIPRTVFGSLTKNRNVELTHQYYSEEVALEVTIREHVDRHALKHRGYWALELADVESDAKIRIYSTE
jgi:hypothetical protein